VFVGFEIRLYWAELVDSERLVDFIPENHICYFVANLAELCFDKVNRKYRAQEGRYIRVGCDRLVIMASMGGIFHHMDCLSC
jgi:hypothetical protein